MKKNWVMFIGCIVGTVASSFMTGYYFRAAKDEWKKKEA